MDSGDCSLETAPKSPYDSGLALVFWRRSVARAEEASKGFHILSPAAGCTDRPLTTVAALLCSDGLNGPNTVPGLKSVKP